MGSTLDSPVTESTTVERAMNGLAILIRSTHSSGDMKLWMMYARGRHEISSIQVPRSRSSRAY